MSDSSDFIVGEVRGQLVGIKESVDRIERRFESMSEKVDEVEKKVESMETNVKLGWKVLSVIGLAAGAGGAGAKHLLEQFYK